MEFCGYVSESNSVWEGSYPLHFCWLSYTASCEKCLPTRRAVNLGILVSLVCSLCFAPTVLPNYRPVIQTKGGKQILPQQEEDRGNGFWDRDVHAVCLPHLPLMI